MQASVDWRGNLLVNELMRKILHPDRHCPLSPWLHLEEGTYLQQDLQNTVLSRGGGSRARSSLNSLWILFRAIVVGGRDRGGIRRGTGKRCRGPLSDHRSGGTHWGLRPDTWQRSLDVPFLLTSMPLPPPPPPGFWGSLNPSGGSRRPGLGLSLSMGQQEGLTACCR